MDSTSGEVGERKAVELHEFIVLEMEDGQKHEFEVVGVVEDEDDGESYAIAYEEALDDFIVTDATGKLMEDGELAQEILKDFLIFAEESAAESG
ncbi:MAG: hypothetical protein GIW95_05590 [Candidatus Eremiobacteraeota bacterium]|nr:hypothetical protein [Candidatus Eremiobacteraeota bacterium]